MKRKNLKQCFAAVLAAFMTMSALCAPMRADTETDKPYISLGADLSPDERATVLNLLDVTEAELEGYTVVAITNEEEHKYLDNYLPASVIGSRALSSAKIEGRKKGNGLQITTKNITYCTKVMYQNALATAGVKDADLIVAGPYNISGTAALVGAMEAYEQMTGKSLKPENVDTATEELVTTSQIAEEIGDQDKAEELIGAVKDVIVAEDISDPDKIEDAVRNAAQKLEISLTDEQVTQIRKLMEKIASLDLNIDNLKEQAKGLYDKLKNLNLDLNISQNDVDGIFAQIGHWFSSLWEQIKSWLA